MMSHIYHLFTTGTRPKPPPEILEVEVDSGLSVDVNGWDEARGLHSTLNQQRAQKGLQPLPLPPNLPPLPPPVHQNSQPPPPPVPISEPVKEPAWYVSIVDLLSIEPTTYLIPCRLDTQLASSQNGTDSESSRYVGQQQTKQHQQEFINHWQGWFWQNLSYQMLASRLSINMERW